MHCSAGLHSGSTHVLFPT
jgi:hypothetical protein